MQRPAPIGKTYLRRPAPSDDARMKVEPKAGDRLLELVVTVFMAAIIVFIFIKIVFL